MGAHSRLEEGIIVRRRRSKEAIKRDEEILVEQTRRWLTRLIYEFCHSDMSTKSGEAFERWHEEKAKDLLSFLKLSKIERIEATKELHVSSSNQRRIAVLNTQEK